jgi:hypothetical protein
MSRSCSAFESSAFTTALNSGFSVFSHALCSTAHVTRSNPFGDDAFDLAGVTEDGGRLLQSHHILRPNDLRLAFEVDIHFG